MQVSAGLDPGFFKDRYLIEIETWDWGLSVGMMPQSTPEEGKPHGELLYTQGVDVRGRILAPKQWAGKLAAVWLSPAKVEYWAGPEALEEVGQFNHYEEQLNGLDFGASVLVPEDSLANVLTCLASIWRYVHIWTEDPFPRASIQMASFSRDLHKNLRPWIEGFDQ
jgi:hypothetical protein